MPCLLFVCLSKGTRPDLLGVLLWLQFVHVCFVHVCFVHVCLYMSTRSWCDAALFVCLSERTRPDWLGVRLWLHGFCGSGHTTLIRRLYKKTTHLCVSVCPKRLYRTQNVCPSVRSSELDRTGSSCSRSCSKCLCHSRCHLVQCAVQSTRPSAHHLGWTGLLRWQQWHSWTQMMNGGTAGHRVPTRLGYKRLLVNGHHLPTGCC